MTTDNVDKRSLRSHLRKKVAARDRAWLRTLAGVVPEAHPLFRVRPGDLANWEATSAKRRLTTR